MYVEDEKGRVPQSTHVLESASQIQFHMYLTTEPFVLIFVIFESLIIIT